MPARWVHWPFARSFEKEMCRGRWTQDVFCKRPINLAPKSISRRIGLTRKSRWSTFKGQACNYAALGKKEGSECANNERKVKCICIWSYFIYMTFTSFFLPAFRHSNERCSRLHPLKEIRASRIRWLQLWNDHFRGSLFQRIGNLK